MATVELKKTVFTGKSNGVAWSVDLAKCSADKLPGVVDNLLAQGATIILQRVKSGEEDGERKDAVPKVAERIQNGTYSFGGGGIRGPRKSYEERAEVQFLEDWARDRKWKAKDAEKFAGEPEKAWLVVARQEIIAALQTNGTTEDELREIDLDALAEVNVPVLKTNNADEIAKKAAELKKADQKSGDVDTTGIILGLPEKTEESEESESEES